MTCKPRSYTKWQICQHIYLFVYLWCC